MSTALVGQQGQQEIVRFKANLKAVSIGAFERYGLGGLKLPRTTFEAGSCNLALHNVVTPEPSLGGEAMLTRGLALPGRDFGLLYLVSLIEAQKQIPVELRGKVVLVATDVLVNERGDRCVAFGDWHGSRREWLVLVDELGDGFGPRCRIVRLGLPAE